MEKGPYLSKKREVPKRTAQKKRGKTSRGNYKVPSGGTKKKKKGGRGPPPIKNKKEKGGNGGSGTPVENGVKHWQFVNTGGTSRHWGGEGMG